MPKKISRKRLLKEPDEFISTTAKILQYMSAHRKQLLRYVSIGLAAVAVAVGGYVYIGWQKERALDIQQHSLLLFGEALRKGATGPGAEKEGYQKAIESFQKSLSTYRWGKSAEFSQLYIGHSHYALKEYDQAEAAYSKCLEGPLRPLALNSLGYCYEARGDYQNALEKFQMNLEKDGNAYQFESRLGAARCYEALNQKFKAAEMYQDLLSKFSPSAMADFIRWKISELKG